MWRRSVRATAQKTSGVPEQSETIATTQRLKQDIRKWELRRDFLEKKAQNLKAKAKAMNAKGDKSGALLHIKKMKLYEKEILKIDGSILQMEEQIIGLEASSLNAEIIQAQELGVNAQRKQLKKVNVERVERMREQMAEMQEEFHEVEELITGGDQLDDESLLDEFEKLIGDAEEDEELDVLQTPQPQVKTGPAPVRAVRKVESAGEDELATLKRLEMSMRGLLDEMEEAPLGTPVIKQAPAKKQQKEGQDDKEFAALEAEMLG